MTETKRIVLTGSNGMLPKIVHVDLYDGLEMCDFPSAANKAAEAFYENDVCSDSRPDKMTWDDLAAMGADATRPFGFVIDSIEVASAEYDREETVYYPA